MTTLQIDNFPEDLYRYIQSLAIAKNVSPGNVVIQLLQQASPITQIETQANDPQHLQITAEALTRIRSRPKINPLDFGFPDSTELIREDRHR